MRHHVRDTYGCAGQTRGGATPMAGRLGGSGPTLGLPPASSRADPTDRSAPLHARAVGVVVIMRPRRGSFRPAAASPSLRATAMRRAWRTSASPSQASSEGEAALFAAAASISAWHARGVPLHRPVRRHRGTRQVGGNPYCSALNRSMGSPGVSARGRPPQLALLSAPLTVRSPDDCVATMRLRPRGAGARGHDNDGSAGAEGCPYGRTGRSDPMGQTIV
jgi:hypothetical protein